MRGAVRMRGSEAGSYTELRAVPGSPLAEPFWRRWLASPRSLVGPPRPMPALRLRLFAPGVLVLEVGPTTAQGLPEITEQEVDDGQFRAIGRLLERGVRLCSPLELVPWQRFARVVVGDGALEGPLLGIPLGDGPDGSAAPVGARPILAAFQDLVARLRATLSSHALVWTPPSAADLELPRRPESAATPKDLFGDGSEVPPELPTVRYCSFTMRCVGARQWLNLYGGGRALLTSEPESDRPARVLAEAELGAEEVRRLVGLAGMSGLVGRLPAEDREGENIVLVELLEGDRYRTGYFVFDAVMGELCFSGGAVQRQAIDRFLEAYEKLSRHLQLAGGRSGA